MKSLKDNSIRFTLEAQYAMRVDEASETVTYIGIGDPGTLDDSAGWAIKRIAVDGNITKTEWADGNGKDDNVWDDRATLSYS